MFVIKKVINTVPWTYAREELHREETVGKKVISHMSREKVMITCLIVG